MFKAIARWVLQEELEALEIENSRLATRLIDESRLREVSALALVQNDHAIQTLREELKDLQKLLERAKDKLPI